MREYILNKFFIIQIFHQEKQCLVEGQIEKLCNEILKYILFFLQGIDYYRNLFEELRRYNITPMVTLSHFDMPYVLENDFGGWLNPESIEWFVEFASLCFEEFSSLVPAWLTFNEPMQTVTGGWENGNWPPGMSSNQESIYFINLIEILHILSKLKPLPIRL